MLPQARLRSRIRNATPDDVGIGDGKRQVKFVAFSYLDLTRCAALQTQVVITAAPESAKSPKRASPRSPRARKVHTT